ncbi:MAG: phosphate ABC transporter substrate-binding protein PstS [Actinomycetes bacterium]
MIARRRGARVPARILAGFAGVLVGLGVTAAPSGAAVTVDGAGSTWSSIAVSQWAADVARQGLSINYQANGSTAGRVFYYSSQVDFAVSEVPFQDAYRDSSGTTTTNEIQLASKRPYAYLPIVAGGTSFMYNLVINGTRLNNLNLSPETLARIFTGGITKWNDPAIAADNPGVPLPALTVRPVIRSDGSGTTAQFTAFMASQTPTVWQAFCQRVGLGAGCRPTSLYPEFPGSTAQQFSDGVAAYVAAPYNNGSITYVEYGYAKQRSFPVASVLNAAGYYAQPTPQAVAIALQGARLNPDRTQVLDGVYRNPDARAYPVSSYSYMIVPTSTASPFTAEKGEVLGRFIAYFLCAGQQKAAQLGYSPLPRVLVEAAFDAQRLIPGAPAPPPIDQCANPTITGDFITGAAPAPPASARKGAVRPSGVAGAGPGAATGGTGATGVDGPTGVDGEATRILDGQLLARAEPIAVRAPSEEPAWAFALLGLGLALVVFGPPGLAHLLRRRGGQR